ncbi:hypothetical protein ACWGNU_21825 [Paenibacillus lautus]
MGKTGRTNKSYSEEVKKEAVRLAIEENMSYREVAYLKAEIAYLKKRYPNLHGE